MDLKLSGKRVLITGASQGIGLGIAEGFAAEGCHLLLAARNAALMAFTQCLGTGSLDDGVRVVAINPGATETQRQVVRWKARAQAAFGDESRWRELTTGFPLGRLARVDEVADVAVFLASERASYVSGAMINVDGGAGFSK